MDEIGEIKINVEVEPKSEAEQEPRDSSDAEGTERRSKEEQISQDFSSPESKGVQERNLDI